MLLTPWESETRLIGMYLATGLLSKEQAQSVLIVSPPGQGKTAMLHRFKELPTVKLMSDLTSNGVRRMIEADQGHHVRNLVLPEFSRVFARDYAVSSQTANLLCNLMTGDAGEERIGSDTFNFGGKQIGVMGAMTSQVYHQMRKTLSDTGLLSRFTVLHVERSAEERDRVMQNILKQDLTDLSLVRWSHFYRPRRDVACPMSLSVSMGTELDRAGVPLDERTVARMVVLLKACALLNGHDTVTPFDLQTFLLFVPYFLRETDVRIDWPTKRKL